ncbi:MAG: LysM peptidoglycan-binding domain-containing protein [Sandaracinus sp.]|nr:LysM peptidoglycan-binding domain-containing protein [Sandaracinus sp.]MCB9619286.1 LysM peptidoglycan-binding domain-containing protein [Sandaracinus sp.]
MARLVLALVFASLALCSSVVAQERQHTVRSGQSLARIASRYRVRVQDLAGANDLSVSAQLREGQVLRIPVDGYHYVRSGETLSTIARRREISVRDLARANRLSEGATLRVGQRLLLPGQVAEEERDQAAARWGRPRRPGVVTLVRPATRERLSLRVLDSRGRPRSGPRRQLAWLLRHRRTNAQTPPDTRLLQLLVRISDHFGGRPIHVLSGFRPAGGHTEESSHHTDGSAIDLRIQGVSNRDLRDFLRTLPEVGVGYYPNSSFVHFDVRRRSAYWVDRSGPGEAPEYVRDRAARERVDEEDAIEAQEQARAGSESSGNDANDDDA